MKLEGKSLIKAIKTEKTMFPVASRPDEHIWVSEKPSEMKLNVSSTVISILLIQIFSDFKLGTKAWKTGAKMLYTLPSRSMEFNNLINLTKFMNKR